MSTAEFIAFVQDRVSLKNPPYPMALAARSHVDPYPRMEVILTTMVPHRDTGRGTTVTHYESLDPEFVEWVTPEILRDWMRRFVERAFEHEAHEALHIDGVRVFDPHEKEKP